MAEYEDLPEKFRNALLGRANSRQPYWALLGIELVDVKKGWAKLKMPFSDKLVQPFGVVNGGAVFSLADSAVAMAILGHVEKGERFATVEMKINYLKSFESGQITAEARILKKGKTIALGDVDVMDEDGDLVGKGLATYMIFGASK